jgi:Protein of unknown function (DUF559)
VKKLEVVKGYRLENRKSPTNSEKRFKPILAEALMGICRPEKEKKQKDKKPYIFQYIICFNPKDVIIVDFLVPELDLIFEIDGGYHDTPEQKEKDRERDRRLRKLGYKVVRIANDDTRYPDRLLNRVKRVILDRIEQSRLTTKTHDAASKPSVSDEIKKFIEGGGQIKKVASPGWHKKIFKGKGNDYPQVETPLDRYLKRKAKKKKSKKSVED